MLKARWDCKRAAGASLGYLWGVSLPGIKAHILKEAEAAPLTDTVGAVTEGGGEILQAEIGQIPREPC